MIRRELGLQAGESARNDVRKAKVFLAKNLLEFHDSTAKVNKAKDPRDDVIRRANLIIAKNVHENEQDESQAPRSWELTEIARLQAVMREQFEDCQVEKQVKDSRLKKRCSWSKDEEKVLLKKVLFYGKNWKIITQARKLEARSTSDCRTKFRQMRRQQSQLGVERFCQKWLRDSKKETKKRKTKRKR